MRCSRKATRRRNDRCCGCRTRRFCLRASTNGFACCNSCRFSTPLSWRVIVAVQRFTRMRLSGFQQDYIKAPALLFSGEALRLFSAGRCGQSNYQRVTPLSHQPRALRYARLVGHFERCGRDSGSYEVFSSCVATPVAQLFDGRCAGIYSPAPPPDRCQPKPSHRENRCF